MTAALLFVLWSACWAQQAEPSLEDTTAFLKSKIEGSTATGVVDVQANGCLAMLSRSYSYPAFVVSNCNVSIRERQTSSDVVQTQNCYQSAEIPSRIETLAFSLSNLAVTSSHTQEWAATDIDKAATEYKRSIYGVVLQ